MANFGSSRNIASDITSGIRAATENPQRIISNTHPHTKQNLKHSKPAIHGQDADPFSVTIVLFTQPRFFFIKIAFCIEGFCYDNAYLL